jgi:hypothetical protein
MGVQLFERESKLISEVGKKVDSTYENAILRVLGVNFGFPGGRPEETRVTFLTQALPAGYTALALSQYNYL